VVSMLDSGTRVRGFKTWPKPSDFLGRKILTMPYFGGEGKPSVADLRHVKEPSTYVEVGLSG
jgi:hypothetical protein